jgi:PAS domain S-box-containing protein
VLDQQSTAVAVLEPLDGGRRFLFRYANPAFQALSPGIPLTGRTIERVWPGIAERYHESARRVLATGEQSVERDILPQAGRGDGSVLFHTIEISRLPLGGRDLIMASLKETTGESTRRQSEMLANLIAHISDILLIVDLHWRCAYASAGMLARLERAGEDVVGLPLWDIVPTELGVALETEYRRVMERGEPEVFEALDASRAVHMEVRAYPIEDGLALLYTDISERRHAEERLRRSEQELAYSKRLLETHLENSPLAVIEFDAQLRVRRWTSGAERVFGWRADEIVGKTIDDVRWVFDEDRELVLHESRGFQDGSDPRSLNVNRNYRKDGSVIWCEWYSSAVYDGDGALVSVLSHAADISARVESTRLRELAAEIDSVLHSSLDADEIMRRAVSMGAEAVRADAAALCLFREGGAVISYVHGWPAERVGMIVPHVSERNVLAVRSQRPVVLQVSTTTSTLAAEHMREWGVKSLLSLPLVVRGRALGMVYLDYTRGEHEFTNDEMTFGERFASSLSLALENARLYDVEHRIARTLQTALLAVPAHVPGITFAWACETATAQAGEVGGDFVDIYEPRAHVAALALGDIAGKGVEAAVTMSLLRDTLRAHTLDGLPCVQVLGKANDLVKRFTPLESFATLFFGLLDTRTGLLRYVCAGHPPALVVSAGGAIEELSPSSPILGALEDVTFAESRTVLKAGDRLVIYSDGIADARSGDGHFFGAHGILATLRENASETTDDLCSALVGAAIGFADGILRDDASVLVVALEHPSRTEIEAQLEL